MSGPGPLFGGCLEGMMQHVSGLVFSKMALSYVYLSPLN